MESRLSDEDAMMVALEEAKVAASEGEVPVGAVVLLGGRLLARDHNRREQYKDPTAHAELLVLRRAAKETGSWRLSEACLYVTLEPCPMCAGAAVAARIGRLVFGAADPKAGACGSLYNICSDPRLNHETEIVPGILAIEGGALLRQYFLSRRSQVGPDSGDGPIA